jgi:deazaflavin-dependent oxidoreductase (nitroreductase family)
MDGLIARLLSTRWLVRAVIPLLRLRLGWLFAGRLVLLEHRGRVSGQRRFVALETVAGTPAGVTVASGFGSSAQWYRNLRANGVAYVTRGARPRRRARPRFMDPGESRRALEEYARERPTAWRHLHSAMVAARGEADPDIPLVVLEWSRE